METRISINELQYLPINKIKSDMFKLLELNKNLNEILTLNYLITHVKYKESTISKWNTKKINLCKKLKNINFDININYTYFKHICDKFSFLKHIELDIYYLQLSPGFFPQSLTKLSFGVHFNQTLEPNVLPLNLTHLIFGKSTQNICSFEFSKFGCVGRYGPGTLYGKYGIIYGDIGDFNKPFFNNVLPSNLIYLRLSHNFNQLLTEYNLPKSLKKIMIGQNYNHELSQDIIDKFNITRWEVDYRDCN